MSNTIVRKGQCLTWLLLAAASICTAAGGSSNDAEDSPTCPETTIALTTTHPWLLPPDESGVLASLFGSTERQEQFFVNDFGQRMVHLPSSSRSHDLQPLPPILQNIDVSVLYDASPVTLRNRSSMDMVNTQRMSYETFHESVINQQGGSATFEITVLEPRFATNPLLPFKRQLEHSLGLPLTFNVYHSGPGGSALQRHSDRYDVFVIQLEGAKEWTLCPPRPHSDQDASITTTTCTGNSTNIINNQADEASFSDTQFRQDDNRPCGVNINDAYGSSSQVFQMQPLPGQHCCKETNVTLRQGMECRKLTLHKGDVMYMPQGIVHSAVVPSSHRISTHAAIGMQKVPFRYADLLSTFLALVASVSSSSPVWTRLQQWLENDILQSPSEGLVFRRLLPPWIWRHYQACLMEQQEDGKQSSSSLLPPPPPRYWKCDHQKYQEAKRFLVASLQQMVVILQDLAYQHVQSTASASPQTQKEPLIGWLDYLVMTEYLENGLVMPLPEKDHVDNDVQLHSSLFQDAINVHLTEKISFDSLEQDERQSIEQSRNMQRETMELMRSMFGSIGGSSRAASSSSSSSSTSLSASSGDDGGLAGLSDLLESLRSELKSSRRTRASYLSSQQS